MLELWSRGDEEGAEPWRLGWLSLMLAESKGSGLGVGVGRYFSGVLFYRYPIITSMSKCLPF